MNGRQELDLLLRVIDDQVVGVAKLEGDALQTFYDLVSGNPATLAFAQRHLLTDLKRRAAF